MDRLPSNIVLEIFSRIPLKSLARFRIVSKLWCEYVDDSYLGVIHGERVVEEPTAIMFHHHPTVPKVVRTLCFHTIEESVGGTSHVLKPNKIPFLEFVLKKPVSTTTTPDHLHRLHIRAASCNGLFYISQDDRSVITNMVVIHPLRKECYELPPLPIRLKWSLNRESCGLGFDTSTNTYKMVYVFLKKYVMPSKNDLIRNNLCTVVHVFGTSSWREIHQVPSYPIQGEAVFSNGCLYWLVSYYDISTDGGRDVIYFDVRKEEFGFITYPPKTTPPPPTERKFSPSYDHLVDLNGQVGYVCNKTMEVWLLKPHKAEWVLHCRINNFQKTSMVTFLGCWNKHGDILFKAIIAGRDRFFVYSHKSDIVHEANLVGHERSWKTGMIMFPNTLFSIHGINTNSNSIRKNNVLKKSCRTK